MINEKDERLSVEKEEAICDFCNQEKGVVQDISEDLSIVICKSCEERMKRETSKYIATCTVCGDECVRCSY